MATNTEDTLQVKQFLGVNRRIKGTARDPRYFETLKNVEVTNIGELKSLGGVKNLMNGITGLAADNYSVTPSIGGFTAANYRITTAWYNSTTFALEKLTQNDAVPFSNLDALTGTTPTDAGFVYKYFISQSGAAQTDPLYVGFESTFSEGFIPAATAFEILIPPGLTAPQLTSKIPAIGVTIYFPGVADFVHVRALENRTDKSYMFFYEPDTTITIPDPDMNSMVFTQNGGAGATRNVKATFVGPAGFRSVATRSVVLGATSTSVTCPTNIPDYVQCVNLYVQTNPAGTWADGYVWVGSFSRIQGEFSASTITFFQPVEGAGTHNTHAISFTSFTITPTGGQIPEGTTVHMGFTPHTGIAAKRVQLADTSGRSVVYTIPPGWGGFQITLNGVTNAVGIPPPNFAATHFVAYVGTEFCLLPHQLIDGRSQVFANAATITVNVLPQNSSCAPGYIDVAYDTPTKLYSFTPYLSTTAAPLQQWIINDYQMSSANGALTARQPQINTLGCLVFPEVAYNGSSFDPKYRRELLPHIDILSLDTTSLEDITNSAMNPVTDSKCKTGWFQDGVLWSSSQPNFFGYRMDSRIFRDIVITVNGVNQAWQANGYVWRPRVQTYGTIPTDTLPIPITAFVEVFKGFLVLTGGPANFANAGSVVYYSNSGNPSVFLPTAFFDIDFSDATPVNGLGLLSQNLSTAGPSVYLIIGKIGSILTWNGETGSGQSVVQMDKSIGFAGYRSFTLTDHGPMFVAQDNVYIVKNFTDVDPVGYEFADVFESLSVRQKAMVDVCWHDNTIKIAYPSVDGLAYNDREIWYRFEATSDGDQKWATGPHEMMDMTNQRVVTIGDERSVRLSCSGFNGVASTFKRDDETISTNNGADQVRQIVITNLGLNRDHFEKLMKRSYLAVNTTQAETFTMTLTGEDGSSGSLVLTFTSGTGKNLLQKQAGSRFSERVARIQIDNTSGQPISLYDISLLYETFRRRIIR